MPWILVKGVLRKMRERRGWTAQYLADQADIAEKTVYRMESPLSRSTVRSDTAQAISAVFDLKLDKYNAWPAADRWIIWVPHIRGDDVDADEVHLEQTGTLAKLAKIERSLNLHALTVDTSAGPADLLGLDRLKTVFSTAKHVANKGQVFAVCGKIDQHESMPSSAAKRLRAVDGDGAIFRVTRAVSKRLPMYVTIFCPTGEITQQLMSAYDAEERVVALVHVVWDPYKGPWRGFYFIEAGAPKAKKFAFVVDKLVRENR